METISYGAHDGYSDTDGRSEGGNMTSKKGYLCTFVVETEIKLPDLVAS